MTDPLLYLGFALGAFVGCLIALIVVHYED